MDKLVNELSNGKHPVIFEPRTEKLSEIKDRLDQGFVFIKFFETQGETELGINIDNDLTCLSEVDFTLGKGVFHVVGTCELNFRKVRCIADIDISSRQGKGYLQLLDEQLDQAMFKNTQ